MCIAQQWAFFPAKVSARKFLTRLNFLQNHLSEQERVWPHKQLLKKLIHWVKVYHFLDSNSGIWCYPNTNCQGRVLLGLRDSAEGEQKVICMLIMILHDMLSFPLCNSKTFYCIDHSTSRGNQQGAGECRWRYGQDARAHRWDGEAEQQGNQVGFACFFIALGL
jgi:hypothetical protein